MTTKEWITNTIGFVSLVLCVMSCWFYLWGDTWSYWMSAAVGVAMAAIYVFRMRP